jgi:tellurite resistance protein TerC
VERETILLACFLPFIILVFLVLDLGYVPHSRRHKITTKSSPHQSIFWVLIRTLFGFFIYQYDGADHAGEYSRRILTSYCTVWVRHYFRNKTFSFRNPSQVERYEYYHRIPSSRGILGAISNIGVIFIFLGALIIHRFSFCSIYAFGVLLYLFSDQ